MIDRNADFLMMTRLVNDDEFLMFCGTCAWNILNLWGFGHKTRLKINWKDVLILRVVQIAIVCDAWDVLCTIIFTRNHLLLLTLYSILPHTKKQLVQNQSVFETSTRQLLKPSPPPTLGCNVVVASAQNATMMIIGHGKQACAWCLTLFVHCSHKHKSTKKMHAKDWALCTISNFHVKPPHKKKLTHAHSVHTVPQLGRQAGRHRRPPPPCLYKSRAVRD